MRFLARRRRKILGVGWSNYEKAPPLLLADFQQGGGFFIGIPLIILCGSWKMPHPIPAITALEMNFAIVEIHLPIS